jgi:DNA modification methylase
MGESEDYYDMGTAHMLRVTTAYWKSQRKVGHLTKITEAGEVINEVISENYKITDKPVYNTTLFKNKTKDNFPLDIWQKWASPVWGDINRTNVLNNYKGAKNEKDEKHIAPLQLDIIERCISLWSNKGETIFTPFLGIGSEIYQAVKMGRKGIGFELKESYYDLAKANIQSVVSKKNQLSLFND